MTAVNAVADEKNEADVKTLLCVDHQKSVEYLGYGWYPQVAVTMTVTETVRGF